jgi:hypothetical protein
MRLTFVVGTGRCGSTMLSAMLRDHPDILSVSELFGTLRAAAQGASFLDGELDGRELWQRLARPFPMLDQMMASGLPIPEMGYPLGRGRFTLATGIPLICHYTLPMLTADPDLLYDTLAGLVPAWPRRPVAAQCEALLTHLAGLLGRPVLVERSAASLTMVDALSRQFPGARFVHLYRDGPDCALSMSRHPVFRREILALAAAYQLGRAAGLDRPLPLAAGTVLPEPFAGLVFPPYDAARLMAYPIGVEAFARCQWSPQICAGVPALGRLAPGRCLSLCYEDLIRDPARALSAFCEFIEVGAPRRWLAAARDMVDPTRSGAAADLAPAALAALRTACAPGTRALAAAHPSPGPLSLPGG